MTNKEKYINFCENDDNIPIFSQPWWLDSVCGQNNWDVCLVEKGGQIWATMPYYKNNLYGLNILVMPKLTQFIGPYIKYPIKQKYYKKLSWEKEVIDLLISQLPNNYLFYQCFDSKIINWLPFKWNNFEQTTRYTYVIKNISLEEFEENLETDVRRRKKKAYELGVEVTEGSDIKVFYEINTMTFTRKGMKMPYSFEFINELYNNCNRQNACKMYFAKYQGKIIAANFLVYDKNTVYYLMGGIDPNYKDIGAMDSILFESIKFTLDSKKVFDFEGSVIKSIETYFRSFGAIQQSYFQITKFKNKFIKLLYIILKPSYKE